MQDEVVGTGQEVHVHHLRLGPDLGDEVTDLAARVELQADRDHRLQRQADRGGVDVGVEAADHAGLLQPAHPAVARRGGDADQVGQRAVGHPRVGVQCGEDATVDVVESNGPNILRRLRSAGLVGRRFC